MERIDLENFPSSPSAKRQISYVSEDFYKDSYVGKWLYQVIGNEYDDVYRIFEELKSQMFPETATWGLMYHEIKWQLPVRDNLPYDERRRLIYQKRDCRAPITPYRMESYLAGATGYTICVHDFHDPGPYGYVPSHPNEFQVTVLEDGTNRVVDYQDVERQVRRVKQSHTVFSVVHRQEFDKRPSICVVAVASELVEYEIMARRDADGRE